MEVKVKFNDINVKEEKEKTLVKILMLKGEKGDSVSAEWGTITGNLENQKDLKNALDSKANQREVTQALNQKANVSDLNNYYNKNQMDIALGSKLGTEDIVDRLDSTADDKVLAAIQGKILNDKLVKKVYYSDTVALMKSSTNLVKGDMVITKGYYEPNDGGAGTYNIVDDDTLIDDGGSIHELDNELFAKLVIENDTINIKQFGAKGDGINDDTIPIQNAINTGLQVYIPEGIFLISSIGFHSNQKIYGTSRNKSILKSIDNNTSTNLLHNADDRSVMFQLDNFKIDGNASNNNNIIDGIFIDNGGADSHCNIDNLRIVDCTGNGINLTRIREARISKCSIWRNHLNGIYFNNDTTDSSINSTVCHTNYQHGIKINSGANRFNDTKCFYNGFVSLPYGSVNYNEQMSGWYCSGIKNIFINCQAQENFGDGFIFYNNSRIDCIGLNVDNNGLKYENGNVVRPTDEELIYSGVKLHRVYQSHFDMIAGNFRTYLVNQTGSQAYALYIEDIENEDVTQQISATISSLEPRKDHVYVGNGALLDINVNSRYYYDNGSDEGAINFNQGYSNATNFPLKLQKFGRLVILSGTLVSENTIPNTDTTVFNIPSAYRPEGNGNLLIGLGKTNEWGNPLCEPRVRVFGSTGNVQVNNIGNVDNVRYIQINGFWFTKN